MAEDMELAVSTLRGAYEAYNRGDFDTTAAALHPEIEWRRVAEVEGTLRGREAVREWMKPEVFARQRVEIREITIHGDMILVRANFVAAGRGSGIEVSQEGYHLWTIRDGLGFRMEVFLDRDEALAAAGPEG